MNNEGRLSLDMLIGLSIFLVTFIFIAQFLPTVFADIRSEIGLAHEAYKVTVLLAETEGAWSDGTHNGTNWEDYSSLWCDNSFVFLPGLMKDEPDFLSYEKIRAFENATEKCYSKIQEMLGLKTPDREYNFNVSLESLDSRPYNRIPVTDKDGNVVLSAGKPIPVSGYMSRFERYVWVDSIYNLVGVYYLNASGGAQPTPVSDCYLPGVGSVSCNFTYDYPINAFIISVEEFTGSAPAMSICGYNSPTCSPGACAIGGDGYIHLNIEGETKDIGLREYTVYDLTNIINGLFKDAGVEQGDVCISISYRHVNTSLYQSDVVDYLSGKAVAKLVVHIW